MSRSNKLMSNMVGGEISPLMYGRVETPVYAKSLAKMENFIAMPQGAAQYRNGTVFVTNTRLNQTAFLLPFQFSDQQAYVLELTPLKMRFYTNNGLVTGNDTVITGATQANPGVITDVAHGYATGDSVTINNVGGMIQLNGNTYTITVVSADTFSIGVNTTAFGAYTAGGKATQVVNISAITNANPGVITATHHQYANGDAVFLSGTGLGIDGQQYLVANSATNTFTLTDLFGNAISTIGAGTYISGGKAARVYEVTTPYVAADIKNIQYAQSADTQYMVNQNYAPMKLIRKSNANWSFATFTRTGTDPFPSIGNYPRAVSFDSAGRLWYGGTLNNPQTIWGSSAPSSGNTAFDDFTTGTAATNSVQFTLAPLFCGKVDYIEWISNTNQFMVLGTFGSVRTLYGAAIGQPVTPSAVTSQPANTLGCSYTLPVANGDTLFYVQRGGQRLRSVEYDFYISGYTTKDQTIIADHLTQPGLQQIIQQRGYPDVMWGVRADGRFLGFTYSRPEVENYAGWHRHYLGGMSFNSSGLSNPYGFVNSMAIATRNQTADQVWFTVSRSISGQTINSVEYLADYQPYPKFHDFYTGDNTGDTNRFNNAMYEAQKLAVYLDMANLYDGSALGFNAGAALTPSAISGSSITITSSAAVFTASMVGQEIHKQYDLNGNGGGRAIITAFNSTTSITCNVTVPFNNTTAMAAGDWYLTATTISGMNYLNGQTVQVVVDGGPAVNATVSGGKITLQAPATTVVVGFQYTGTIETLDIDSGGKTGPAQSKPRIQIQTCFRFLNSLGTQYGTNYYRLEQLVFRQAGFTTDRPTVPYTGLKYLNYQDRWTDQNANPQKKAIIIQAVPLPCTVLSIDVYLDTSDD